ncbi:dienelactone hydrolase endo-1,3,1,4-beta-D-glucanase [Cyathus striatus]|nr:dienelactone hydrolase endo-1,3,1,4-beta-D-glucanase [Cyathus striatus]
MSCPDCFKGALLPGEPKGTINKDGSYLAAYPEGNLDRTVVLLTDIFGLPVKNCKLMADEFSQSLGCDVWVPDMFAGIPPVSLSQVTLPDQPGTKKTFWDRVKFIFTMLKCLPWFWRSRPAVAQQRVDDFITKIKAEQGYKKVGAVGYCYGGTIAFRLAANRPKVLDAMVIAHPGPISLDYLKAISVPSSWACAEEDDSFPKEKRLKVEAILEQRKDSKDPVPYEFKDYNGTVHGFATRPNLTIPEVKAGYEGAFNQAVEWFKRYL